eukprot:TRINITY_DN25180_c0_g1_i3.p1 TRINITY_DN25180_c0_g1~~TRINITY_DN25180_c0_g1_i3.p1  ORF type:complete len:557 (-),score=74.37 TRINITY_DN25180_c0_g1_i3:58-1728(-)
MAISLGMQLLNFCIAWAGSWKIGAQFPNVVGLPMIVGYMLVGFACGKYMTGMMNPETVNTTNQFSIATVVSNVTLAFIAFSAGSELHVPSLGPKKLKQIAIQILMMGLFMLLAGTPLIFMLEWLLPDSLLTASTSCKWSVAWLVAVVQWAGSVIEVLAIYHETKGNGPVTQMMIGTTMLLDMVVLVFFAISQNVTIAACPLEGVGISVSASVLSVIGSICLWAAFGVLLGLVLQAILMIPPMGPELNTLKPKLIVLLGGVSFYQLLKLNKVLPSLFPSCSLLRVDPLLVCMIAAIWANHISPKRDGFREILNDLAPLVMPPFFTIAGATLDLEAILDNAAAPPVLFVLRFAALAVGSFVASSVSGHDQVVRNHLWMTLQSQSGVTLGLVAQMQLGVIGQQPWSKGTSAIIIGCVVLNQLVGPTLCRFGLYSAGEVPTEEDEEVRSIIGVDMDLQPIEEAESQSKVRRSSSMKAVKLRREAKRVTIIEGFAKSRPRTASSISMIGTFEQETEMSRTRSSMSLILPHDDHDDVFGDEEPEENGDSLDRLARVSRGSTM